MDNISKMEEKGMFSIIIPCMNEEAYLPGLLSAIRGMDTRGIPYEIILADNGSADASIDIALIYGAEIVVNPKASIAGLRNLGALHAKGEVFAFLDADCLPARDWLKNAVPYLGKGGVGMFGSMPVCPADATWVQRAWSASAPQKASAARFLCTGNMMVKKDAFNHAGGFDEALETGEDYDLCQRVLGLGYGIVHDRAISVTHLRSPRTLLGRLKKEIWYGKNTFEILGVNPGYKPFWASLAMGLSELGLMARLAQKGLNPSLPGALFLALPVVLPVMSAWYKARSSRRMGHLMRLSAVFFFYLNGRFLSLFPALLQGLKRRARRTRG